MKKKQVINKIIYQVEGFLTLIDAPANERELIISRMHGLLHHDTYMANALIKVLRREVDPRCKLIGGFGRRTGTYSETHTDIDVQMSVKRTPVLERKLRALLKPRAWEYTTWFPRGIFMSRTEEFGNVDLFFGKFN